MATCNRCNSELATYEFNRSPEGVICNACAQNQAVQQPPSEERVEYFVDTKKSMGSEAVTGLLMVVGAIIWFVAGLAGGIIFYYPPVLLIIGLIRFFTAITRRT